MISTASTLPTGSPIEWNATPAVSERSKPAPANSRSPLNDCRLVHLPKISDPDGRGSLTFAEGRAEVPFAVRRSYWIYDVPGGERRQGHAYKTQQEFIIALSGSFRVVLDDGDRRLSFQLNRSYYGLYVTPRIWREIDDFSTNSVCLVLSSDVYRESEYWRDYRDFAAASRTGGL
jgi:hypothetical protein